MKQVKISAKLSSKKKLSKQGDKIAQVIGKTEIENKSITFRPGLLPNQGKVVTNQNTNYSYPENRFPLSWEFIS